MNTWQKQEVRNEANFRDLNEWIEAANDEAAGHHAMDAYICECGDVSCTGSLISFAITTAWRMKS